MANDPKSAREVSNAVHEAHRKDPFVLDLGNSEQAWLLWDAAVKAQDKELPLFHNPHGNRNVNQD